MPRSRVPLYATAATLFALLSGATSASAYSVAVRWTDAADRAVAGYRLYVRPAGGTERPPIDVPRPRHDGSGRFETRVGNLEVETTYVFTLSAYSADGTESERSNSRTIGYAQAARVVDSDYDGLTDAEEDVNLNQRVDAGETDRLVADTDGDEVPDGLERKFGSNPFDPQSPSCGPLGFSEFRPVGYGTTIVGWDTDLDKFVLATTPFGRVPTGVGVMYPQYGRGDLDDPIFVSRVRDNDPFRIDVRVRSTEGKMYRMRFEGHGRVDRATRRRLRRSLGNHFSGDRWQLIGLDIETELRRMDATAVFSHIERLTVRGSLAMEEPRVCH